MKFSQTLNRKQILVRRKRMCLCVKKGVRKGERAGRRERGREGGSKEEKKKWRDCEQLKGVGKRRHGV